MIVDCLRNDITGIEHCFTRGFKICSSKDHCFISMSKDANTESTGSAKTNDENLVFNSGFRNRLHHTSKDHISRLNNVIVKSTLVGGLYGALISIPTELLIRWRSPLYRAFGFRIRVFYHTIWIASAAAFHAEREVIEFENKIRAEEAERRRQLLELSIMSGNYTSQSELALPNKK